MTQPKTKTTNNAGTALVHSSEAEGLNTTANASPRSPAPEITQITPDDVLQVKVIKPEPFTQEDIAWINKMGWGVMPIKKITIAESLEEFPCQRKP